MSDFDTPLTRAREAHLNAIRDEMHALDLPSVARDPVLHPRAVLYEARWEDADAPVRNAAQREIEDKRGTGAVFPRAQGRDERGVLHGLSSVDAP